ncbi:Nif3-like dinuclear metal center hexameric protein [Fictibacillus sp. Mic-4]|uniref:Nif3-like dinuclear metal center hexameric protein n=1 Tax=Fictibacillus TaxID=1329200 RepID=UPI00041E7CAF|nr:Nif3-like dinuclear metal center hexameric protein [Fictibacillus gelatini]
MVKPANGQWIISIMEKFAPKSLAEEGDPIGLQVGTLNKPVKKVMIALDVLETVVDEAIEKGVDLIIAHHPMIYRPLKRIDTSRSQGRVIEKLIKNDITVYAAHTNLDVAQGGVNDWLAEALKLTNTTVLKPTTMAKYIKLAVFVPKSHVDKVRDAISSAGAGHIGNYSHCTFNSSGLGTFKPLEGTNPYIGKLGELEIVDEVKIETIVPEALKKAVISEMLHAHPYEEVAYDVYPLENEGEFLGIGKIGQLEKAMTLEEFVQHVKNSLHVNALRVIKGHNRPIQKVAVVGGDGNKFISAAQFKGADVLVTGDIYYHNAHDAQAEGLTIIDPGHNIEKIMKKGLQQVIAQSVKEKKYDTEVICSEVNTDPFMFM